MIGRKWFRNIYIRNLRLSYINLHKINKLAKIGALREVTVNTLIVHEYCLEGKMTEKPFSAKQ